jgi:flagellar biosynthesis/type III secretory pathway protein FliH
MNTIIALALVALALLLANYAGFKTGLRLGRRQGFTRGQLEAAQMVSSLIDGGLIKFSEKADQMLKAVNQ